MLANFLREYNINRLFLSITGLWPFQNKLARNSLQTFCFLVEISYCPFEILLIYDHWDDMQTIFEGCYQMAISSTFLMRIANEFFNHDKLRRLYEIIDEHWDIFTSDIEIQVLKDYSTLARKFTKYYSIMMYFLTSGFVIIPLTPVFLDIVLPLNKSRPRFLAIEVEFRINKDEYFLPIFCYTTAIIIVGMNIVVSVDAMHITCTSHACSLFAAVSKQIESLVVKTGNKNEIRKCGYYMNTFDTSSEETVYREYITCLKKHQLAIKFVSILESSCRELSLVTLILFIGVLSVTGIRIVYVLDQLGEVARFAFIIIGAFFSMLIVCYSGQKLMDESQNVFYQVYATKWYDFSPRLKSLLIIILYRSNIPCGLKAGNIIPLSIATYAAVIRMGVSYFTAFLSLKD
ncbi:odorant receptor 63a-like isoform X1 [Camponotus floridanus]|uniref:odorant receptor 63a-like isoform X1 n=2 Tax=Camponotus floridanus TaxID=104421 RepID=UPI000DC67FF0|nr:odorant receptor 63a-like isoform X1 [Camponotus floridanus]